VRVLRPRNIGSGGLVIWIRPICVSVALSLLWLLLLLGISINTGGWRLFLAMCGIMFW
jgi:hypothetical protein